MVVLYCLIFSYSNCTLGDESEVIFRSSLLELKDDVIPIRAHGMAELRSLISKKDPIIEKNLKVLLAVFLDLLMHDDRYFPFFIVLYF
jgi:hypothetical protein